MNANVDNLDSVNSFENINFELNTILCNMDSFFYNGFNGNLNEDCNKIEVIENSLNKAHKELFKALNSTHTHKKNMVYTYTRLIEMYQLALPNHSFSDYYSQCISKLCLKNFEDYKDNLKALEQIITLNEFSHNEQDILLRPYKFEIKEKCWIPQCQSYKELRKKVTDKIIEIINSFLHTNQLAITDIDERIRNLFTFQESNIISQKEKL